MYRFPAPIQGSVNNVTRQSRWDATQSYFTPQKNHPRTITKFPRDLKPCDDPGKAGEEMIESVTGRDQSLGWEESEWKIDSTGPDTVISDNENQSWNGRTSVTSSPLQVHLRPTIGTAWNHTANSNHWQPERQQYTETTTTRQQQYPMSKGSSGTPTEQTTWVTTEVDSQFVPSMSQPDFPTSTMDHGDGDYWVRGNSAARKAVLDLFPELSADDTCYPVYGNETFQTDVDDCLHHITTSASQDTVDPLLQTSISSECSQYSIRHVQSQQCLQSNSDGALMPNTTVSPVLRSVYPSPTSSNSEYTSRAQRHGSSALPYNLDEKFVNFHSHSNKSQLETTRIDGRMSNYVSSSSPSYPSPPQSLASYCSADSETNEPSPRSLTNSPAPSPAYSTNSSHDGGDSRAFERDMAPRYMQLPVRTVPKSKETQDEVQQHQNALLLHYRTMGLSYKAIKDRMMLDEAESTLRGRYRTLTKPKEQRLRRPMWSEEDIALLVSIVDPTCPQIKWKQISDEIVARGGSYRFGSSTCKKRYLALVAEGMATPLVDSERRTNSTKAVRRKG